MGKRPPRFPLVCSSAPAPAGPPVQAGRTLEAPPQDATAANMPDPTWYRSPQHLRRATLLYASPADPVFPPVATSETPTPVPTRTGICAFAASSIGRSESMAGEPSRASKTPPQPPVRIQWTRRQSGGRSETEVAGHGGREAQVSPPARVCYEQAKPRRGDGGESRYLGGQVAGTSMDFDELAGSRA